MAPFVKLDVQILDSSLWLDLDAREIFITSLLMAEPFELLAATPQLRVRAIEPTGFIVPAGWYGIVRAAGIGIVKRAGLELERGLAALERLGEPEPDSRSPDHGGRRLVRVDGGFIVLNFVKYRERDYGGAERAKRYRERQRSLKSVTASRRDGVTRTRDVTQAEAEAEAEKNSSRSRSKSKHSPAAPTAATAQTPLELDGSAPREKADPALALFHAWCEVFGKSDAELDRTRRKLLERWLRELQRKPAQPGETAERQALNAIMGCASSDWHRQSDDRHNLSVIFRNRERVEKFIRWSVNPPAPSSRAEQRLRGNAAAVATAITEIKSGEWPA